jgi:hypothetical protein
LWATSRLAARAERSDGVLTVVPTTRLLDLSSDGDYYRYQQSLIDEAITTLGPVLHKYKA